MLVGDVWLGSGRSNMELEVGGMHSGGEAASWADHPLIRLLDVPRETSDEPQDDIPGAMWKICTPATAAPFSAVAFYFARDVHQATGLVVTTDVGAPDNMHQTVKEPVGQRAACWALSQVYHADDRTCSSPLYRAMEVKGNKAVIHFHRNGLKLPLGLQNPLGKNGGFIIAGTDRVWHEAQAAIAGETVEVWSDKVPEPAAVCCAWEDFQRQVNLLVNAAGLPASPFRTDQWVPEKFLVKGEAPLAHVIRAWQAKAS